MYLVSFDQLFEGGHAYIIILFALFMCLKRAANNLELLIALLLLLQCPVRPRAQCQVLQYSSMCTTPQLQEYFFFKRTGLKTPYLLFSFYQKHTERHLAVQVPQGVDSNYVIIQKEHKGSTFPRVFCAVFYWHHVDNTTLYLFLPPKLIPKYLTVAS